MAESQQTLRDRYAEAISSRLRNATPFPPRVTMTDSAYPNAHALADAVLAVRDDVLADALRRAEEATADLLGLAPLRDSLAAEDRLRRERNEWRAQCELAEAALARVRALHVPVTRPGEAICDACSPRAGDGPRRYVAEPWPCDTIRALDVPADPITKEIDHG